MMPAIAEYIVLLEELGEARMEYRDAALSRICLLVDLTKVDGKTQVAVYSVSKVGDWARAFRTLEYGAKGIAGCP